MEIKASAVVTIRAAVEKVGKGEKLRPIQNLIYLELEYQYDIFYNHK